MALNAEQTAAANALFAVGALPATVARDLGISMGQAVLAWRAWQAAQ